MRSKVKNNNQFRVYLTGGLGNQLFGYAFGVALSELSARIPIFDRSLIRNREFELNSFSVLKNLQFDYCALLNMNTVGRVGARIIEKLPKSYVEIDSNIPKMEDILKFRRYFGYFQTWENVHRVETKIKVRIGQLHTPSQAFENIQREIRTSEAIVIHVRRGDYMDNKHIYNINLKEYYSEALEIAKRKVGDKPVFVFSDEVFEAKKLIAEADNFIGPTDLQSAPEVLHAMSSGQFFIGANSSLSWWSAFIHTNQENLIFPKLWLATPNPEIDKMLSPNWRVI
jgi:hypothetical protein